MADRAHWGSKVGFVLAAAGSAVGLGNIWRFPYITGENGGGLFVVVYLGCIALVGLPVMAAEIMLGRASQQAPVGAFRKLAGPRSPWIGFGWLGVIAAGLLLSFYSVVAGWTLHYGFLSISGQLSSLGPDVVANEFSHLVGTSWLNLAWHGVFMLMTAGVVAGGVSKGVERWSVILMPALFVMMGILLVRAFTLSGWDQAMAFIYGFHSQDFTRGSLVEALGHSFFTLSLGMGAMLTYGSYLHTEDDIMSASILICVVDTVIALLATMILFPIIFTNGMAPNLGPGLVFQTIPIALVKMPATGLLGTIFFSLLLVAALTSAISMLEVTASSLIDEKGWSRHKATWVSAAVIAVVGIPAALSNSTALFGADVQAVVGENWFDAVSDLVSNWMLPMGGLAIAIFTAWRMDEALRHYHFLSGSRLKVFYRGWLLLLKFLVPVAIALIFLSAVGLISSGS